MLASMILTIALSVIPPTPQAAEPPPPIDLETAVRVAALRVVAEDIGATVVWIQERDPETGRFVATPAAAQTVDNGAGFFSMLYGNSYDPAVLAFFAASVAEMYSAADLRTQCGESTIVSCSDPFPASVSTDALITAGVYLGVTGLQRLAKTQWGVETTTGWKNVLVWGGIAAVRGLLTASNLSDSMALRDLGR